MDQEGQLDYLGRFKAHLLAEGLKLTRQRQTIAECFFQTESHLTLGQLLELARSVYPSIGYATVYRTMKVLTTSGLALEHKFDEGQSLYEVHVEGEHHDHIVCVRCGRITEFEDELIEARQLAIAEGLGFRVTSHRHVLYGECMLDCEERG
jgi:Fur family ferric uptake transcriptional regulator